MISTKTENYLFSFLSLLADIGGILGLLLGYSIFHIAAFSNNLVGRKIKTWDPNDDKPSTNNNDKEETNTNLRQEDKGELVPILYQKDSKLKQTKSTQVSFTCN